MRRSKLRIRVDYPEQEFGPCEIIYSAQMLAEYKYAHNGEQFCSSKSGTFNPISEEKKDILNTKSTAFIPEHSGRVGFTIVDPTTLLSALIVACYSPHTEALH